MPPAAQATARDLIELIQTRYHEGHRRAFGPLRALLAALPADCLAQDLAAATHRLFDQLEQHMFKEEMRLFPMMEQGGNTLLWQLVDAMCAEHLGQRDQIRQLQSGLSLLVVPAGCEALLAELRQTAGKLFADLIEHMDVEDEVLFQRFGSRGRH